MESTEKSQVRKTFSVRLRIARMLSATSTEIPPSGESTASVIIDIFNFIISVKTGDSDRMPGVRLMLKRSFDKLISLLAEH